MKLFPANSFSPGQNPSDSSLRKSKDDTAFASLMKEESADWSRNISNDSSMGHAEESHEAAERPDQAASNGRRKAESRSAKRNEKVREAKDSNNTTKAESPAKAGASPEGAEEVTRSKQPVTTEEANTASESTGTVPEEVSAKALDESATLSALPGAEVQSVVGLEMVPELDLGDMPATVVSPLVQATLLSQAGKSEGATLLSPAALGNIEGLASAHNASAINLQAGLTAEQAEISQLGEFLPTLSTGGKSSSQGQADLALPLNQIQQPVLDAVKASSAEGLPQQLLQQVEALPSAAESGAVTAQSISQTEQSMLGGSVFQELLQKSQGNPFLGLKDHDRPVALSEGETAQMPASELPEAFQEAKAIWTNVETRPSVLQENAETISQLHSVNEEIDAEVEVDGEVSPAKETRPLQGLQRSSANSMRGALGNQSSQVIADVTQNQSLEQRIEIRTETQNILMQEVAPTPEGHVPALTEVMVEVDEDLRVGVKTTGREVAVSIDGTTRAVEEMRGIGPELQESLENLGFTLSEFTANDEGEGESNENNAQTNSSTDDGSQTASSNQGPLRQVRRGAQIDTTA